MKTYAVLTGDLIDSRKLDAAGLDRAMDRIRQLAGEFAAIHTGSIVGTVDVFRGDSWQLCLTQPTLAVTAAVFIRAGLKSDHLDTRIGLGFGAVERLHEEQISLSTGPAFVASGQALDSLTRDRALAARFPDPAPATWAVWLGEIALPLLDLALAEWTQRESVAAYGIVSGLTQAAAAELPAARAKDGSAPTRQAIHDALHRIRWSSHLDPVLKAIENHLDIVSIPNSDQQAP